MHAVPTLVEAIAKLDPESILDVGVGFGKYGVLLREALEIPQNRYDKQSWKIRIDGVEAFEKYRNPLHDFAYNHLYYEAIENLLPCLSTMTLYSSSMCLSTLRKKMAREYSKNSYGIQERLFLYPHRDFLPIRGRIWVTPSKPIKAAGTFSTLSTLISVTATYPRETMGLRFFSFFRFPAPVPSQSMMHFSKHQ